MKYQLVVQWPASSTEDYDEMVEAEDVLIEKLGPDSEVDGHDAGSGEMNIFIRTDDPKKTFGEVKKALSTRDMWKDARVAYREKSQGEYTILWPTNLKTFKVT